MVLALGLWGLYRERTWITRYLREEVERGILPDSIYRDCRSLWRRGVRRWGALLRGDLREWWQLGRVYHVAIELAFRKHQRESIHEAHWESEIVRLLRELQRLLRARGDSGNEATTGHRNA